MGDITAFIAGQAEGAIPNGSRVVKQNSEKGDGHPNGTQGIVYSSLATPAEMVEDGWDPFFYFVDWGEGVPVGTLGSKVKEVGNEQ